MASRKEQKEEARARRLAEERARAERARRQRRMQMIGGIVVGAVIVVVALVLISSGGGKKETGLQTGTNASATVTGINGLLAEIPQSGNRLGRPTAPETNWSMSASTTGSASRAGRRGAFSGRSGAGCPDATAMPHLPMTADRRLLT